MTTFSEQDLIYEVLSSMSRRDSGEAPSSDDYDECLRIAEAVVEQLVADRVVFIDDIDSIDGSVFLPLARRVACDCVGKFGNSAMQSLLANTRSSSVDSLQAREEQTLKRISSQWPTYRPIRAEFF